jgi:peptidoglycan/LPS O-acetylase OafA/YrhL
MKNKRLIFLLAIAGLLLTIPLIAMQFTQEVNWNITDFIKMAALLFGIVLLCDVVLKKVKSTKWRLLICGIVLLIFFLIWAELAVGIFGTPFAGS